ncbi:amino acid ABC transporter permease [Aquibium sp. A9E412]|uniref:amino acid ABC transporter permease n=1 Tax=Aquibium sp. A9E412 TaxID=2976767 RepID=UPI0025B17F0E|nr:amino acid ABC transporter permease [Aquibium sp. A9E412]MDN2564985.1 amino acid ABC transporter permease [Aquibium sp. A9E412]
MAAHTHAADEPAPKVALLNDPKIRAWIFQAVLLVVLAWLVWVGIQNMFANLRAANISSGFGFLGRNAGFAISQSLIEYEQASSTYGRVFMVGLLNTLLVSAVGIVIATILGFIVGIARLSPNWVLARLAAAYIETLRNIPLLLQIFVWYFSVLRLLPSRREALDLGFLGQINISGWYAPRPVLGEGSGLIGWALLIAVVAVVALARWARRRQEATGERLPVLWPAIGLIVGLPLVAYLAAGMPLAFEYPEQGNFGPRGGTRVYPEFIGLLLALSFYTAAFIAEIVRAGILAVNRGQTEASYALGLRPGQTLRLVIVPQALRIIIPPLTSQYLNLTKNSSLAVAIAYPDLVSVFAGTALNQTGQAVEILMMTMLTYLALSLLISAFMNWYNAKMALVER